MWVSVWVRKKQYPKSETYEKQKPSKSDDFEDFWQAISFWISSSVQQLVDLHLRYILGVYFHLIWKLPWFSANILGNFCSDRFCQRIRHQFNCFNFVLLRPFRLLKFNPLEKFINGVYLPRLLSPPNYIFFWLGNPFLRKKNSILLTPSTFTIYSDESVHLSVVTAYHTVLRRADLLLD